MIKMSVDRTEAVTISLEEYVNLVASKARTLSLFEAIYQDASLSYDKRHLRLSDTALELFLRVADSKRYWKVYNIIKDKEENNDTDD